MGKDPEIQAMETVSITLSKLDEETVGRVLRWAVDRHTVGLGGRGTDAEKVLVADYKLEKIQQALEALGKRRKEIEAGLDTLGATINVPVCDPPTGGRSSPRCGSASLTYPPTRS